MKNLFKYASEHWKALLAIVAILIVQAYCDLSLPAYTSDIVNVGIQQGGVEDHIPDAISAEDMETLLLLKKTEKLFCRHMKRMTKHMKNRLMS